MASLSRSLWLSTVLAACGSPASTPGDASPHDAANTSDSLFAGDARGVARWIHLDSGVTTYLTGVWVKSPTEAYVVGEGGTILRYDGTSFTAEVGGGGIDLGVVRGDGNGIVLALGKAATSPTNGYSLRRGVDGHWSPEAGTLGAIVGFEDLMFTGPDDGYGIGYGIMHRKGGRWIDCGQPFGSFPLSVWADSGHPTQVFAGGANSSSGQLIHGTTRNDGTILWDPATSTTSGVNLVYGFSASDVYAASLSANLHWDGQAWTPTELGSHALLDLWGTSGDDLYGVGAAGVIMHRTLDGVTVEPSGVNTDLSAISGSGTLVLAVGSDGVVLRRVE